MPWFKADDGLSDNKKTRRAGTEAMGLWVIAGSWCARELTDGFIPEGIAARWDPRGKYAKKLVAAGFWEPAERDGERGYQYINWSEYQPVKADVEAERAAARDRMRQRRAARNIARTPKDGSEDVRANTSGTFDRSSGEVRGPRPDPTRPIEEPTHPERQSHVTDARENGPLHGPVVDASGWKLVRETIPDEHPHATRTDLAMRAGALLKSGTPEADVRQALALWLDKPKLGPATLPSLVSEVVRNRSRPAAAAHAEGAATTKARGWLDVANQLDPAVATAAPSLSPPHPRAIEP